MKLIDALAIVYYLAKENALDGYDDKDQILHEEQVRQQKALKEVLDLIEDLRIGKGKIKVHVSMKNGLIEEAWSTIRTAEIEVWDWDSISASDDKTARGLERKWNKTKKNTFSIF